MMQRIAQPCIEEQTLLREVLDLVWSRFKVIAGIIGDFEASLIAIGFYYTILVPFGLIARFSNKSDKRQEQVAWLEREPVSPDIDLARRQG